VGEAGFVRSARLGAPAPLVLGSDDLALFVLNVGDGDAMVLRLPAETTAGDPTFAIVDCVDANKTLALLAVLGATRIRFLCATHPHLDHIAGMRALLVAQAGRIEEFWDSGFRYTSATYRGVIDEVIRQAVRFVRPTSGFETRAGGAQISVLSPSIALRNRFDTHGVDVNNASIVLRITYPVATPAADYPASPGSGGAGTTRSRTLILGADAQTDAWGQVLQEFPHLDGDDKVWARQIGSGTSVHPLACDFFKVSHHASKRGVSLEVLERLGDRNPSTPSVGPRWLVASCASGSDSQYGFPHGVTQDLLREVRDPQAQAGGSHPPDDQLGIHFTAQSVDDGGPPAGSVCYVARADGTADLYRFGDARSDAVDLTKARRVR
jgi:beta-lactamase superfamily II metal-dependent hydrolase